MTLRAQARQANRQAAYRADTRISGQAGLEEHYARLNREISGCMASGKNQQRKIIIIRRRK